MTRGQAKEQRRRDRRARLLAVLRREEAGACLPAAALAEASGAGDAVLPLLARLERDGWLEPVWLTGEHGPALHYRITAAGAEALAAGD